MKKNTQGLKLYDSLDLSESKNKKKLLDIYQKWAALYDKDNDDELGTVSVSYTHLTLPTNREV